MFVLPNNFHDAFLVARLTLAAEGGWELQLIPMFVTDSGVCRAGVCMRIEFHAVNMPHRQLELG